VTEWLLVHNAAPYLAGGTVLLVVVMAWLWQHRLARDEKAEAMSPEWRQQKRLHREDS
jgi:hypothetical protein